MIQNSKQIIVLKIIILLGILSYASWQFYQDMVEVDDISTFIEENYSNLLLKDSIDSKVISMYKYPSDWRNNQNFKSLKFENGIGYTIKIRRDLTSEDIYFGDIVNIGTTIRKNFGSDTLEVITNGEKYKYLIFGTPNLKDDDRNFIEKMFNIDEW